MRVLVNAFTAPLATSASAAHRVHDQPQHHACE
jgi:hypothetical protein